MTEKLHSKKCSLMRVLNQRINIDTKDQYDFILSKGFQPLFDWKHFILDIHLRVEIQRYLFGKSYFGRGNIKEANQRFYEWNWKYKAHYCQETIQTLHNYHSVHISHINGRGAHPEMANDPRNVNILNYFSHQKWEDEKRRKGMRIYDYNIIIIKMLQEDYKQLNF